MDGVGPQAALSLFGCHRLAYNAGQAIGSASTGYLADQFNGEMHETHGRCVRYVDGLVQGYNARRV